MLFQIELHKNYDPKYPMDSGTYLRYKMRLQVIALQERNTLLIAGIICTIALSAMIIGLNLIG